MSSFHTSLGYVAIVVSGVVGIWGVSMWRRSGVPKPFYWGVAAAIAAMLAQVLAGVALLSMGTEPGDQHTFYGGVIAVTLSFAYIYRAQFRQRPAISYGLLLLFTMGLGIRGIMTFGMDF